MRWLCALLFLWPAFALGQSNTVLPHELKLEVSVEDTGVTPLAKEMVILTIRGTYRRHITRETLVQPDFEGFNWSQLGPDNWQDTRLDGKRVKIFTRRMAIYPDRAGELTIDAFRHRLTLTDEGDDWFDHEIQSDPITITVDPAPPTNAWWFPVRDLKISDEWSNAPDQLQPGEGVLRVIRLEALGATPEMIPPMPTLRSPSGMVFPHPEKRLVELTPSGPLTYAFWRWTIRPGNDVSTVVEPLSVEFFNTTTRQAQSVTISPQRVAYGDAIPVAPAADAAFDTMPPEGGLPGALALFVGLGVFAVVLAYGMRGRDWSWPPRLPEQMRNKHALRMAARQQKPGEMRRALLALSQSGPEAAEYRKRLAAFDADMFSAHGRPVDLRRYIGMSV